MQNINQTISLVVFFASMAILSMCSQSEDEDHSLNDDISGGEGDTDSDADGDGDADTDGDADADADGDGDADTDGDADGDTDGDTDTDTDGDTDTDTDADSDDTSSDTDADTNCTYECVPRGTCTGTRYRELTCADNQVCCDMGADGDTGSDTDTDIDTDTDGDTDTDADADTDTDADISGTCTASETVTSINASGSGPHEVVVETNADSGINEGTIYRPADLGGTERYPIFAWGEGGCSLDGSSNATSMAEIASHGYFVIADGTPNGSGSRRMDGSNIEAMGAPLLAYISWIITENNKPCSVYYHSIDTKKVSTNGFSCGGMMAEGTATDPRITTWAINSSGMAQVSEGFYETIVTPMLMVEGGPSDMAYENGLIDYDAISALGVPIMFFSKDLGHGGDLFTKNGGDFTKINLAWLNWWLKGDEGATGKGVLVGDTCTYCSDSSWEVMSANLP